MYKRAAKGWLKHFDFLIWDFVSLQMSVLIAYMIRHGVTNPYIHATYRNMSILLMLLEVFAVFFMSTLKNVLKRGYWQEFKQTVKQAFGVTVLSVVYLFFIQAGDEYSRTTLFLTGVLYFGISYLTRVLWKKYLKKQMVGNSNKRSLLMITGQMSLPDLMNEVHNHNYEGFRIAGLVIVDQNRVGQYVDDVPVVTDMDHVVEYVCREWVDEVFICLPEEISLDEQLINQFVEMGVAVHLKLMKTNLLTGQKKFIERVGNYTVLTMSENTVSQKQMFYKRTLDILGGLIGCVITGVLFLVIAPIIKIQSPGPVLFTQERVGQNGKKFKLYKFRSMYLDAEQRKADLMAQNQMSDGMMFKMAYDPRIIGSEKGDGKGFGNFIRKHSIDEMPQFFNVLKGDMSLVGTRPPTVDEWEKYELHHRARLAFKPGLTGLWQVSGRSNITDFEEVVKLDKKYISEWNFGKDIKILMQTVKVVAGQDGAV